MDDFDLKKYLAEGKLREGIFDRFKNTSEPQNPKSDSPFFPNREISDNRLKIEKFIDKEWSRYTGAIEYNEIDDIVNGIEKEWVDNISKYSNIDAFLKDFKEDKRLKKYLAEGKLFEAEVKEYIVTKDDWKKSKFNFEGLADSEFKIKIGGEGKYQKYMLFWKEGGKKYWEWEAGNMTRQLRSALISIAKRKLPITDTVAEGRLSEDIFGKYATRKAPKDTADANNPDYDLYMGNNDTEYRKFYMALKRLIEKSNKNLDKNFEILDWIENLLNHIKPEKNNG